MIGVITHLHKTRELLEKADYNPFYGTRLVVLDETVIGDVAVCLCHSQIDPDKEITAHMLEHNGEIAQVFSEVVLFLGKPVKDEKGDYCMEGDKVIVDWDKPMSMQSGDTIQIPEGVAHYFINKNIFDVAHIQFVIPKNHFTPNESGVIDRKPTTKPLM